MDHEPAGDDGSEGVSDPGVAGQLRLSSTRGRLALGACVLASGVAFLDGTVVNVAVPSIADEFGVGVEGVQWVLTGYLLTLASLILLGGALGDRYGRRRVFVVGAVLFAGASLGCALAPSLGILVGARVVQGVGGALLTPTALALVQASFVPEDRGAAVGAWSGLTGLAGALGPFLGGWLVDGPGWRWAFILSVPLAAVAVIATRAMPVEEPVAPSGHRSRFDIGGAVLAVSALAGLTLALNRAAAAGWGDGVVVGAIVVTVAAGMGFLVWEGRAKDPLVPGQLFRSRVFTVLSVATFALYALLSSVFFFVGYQLQVVAGFSALAAGAALVPGTLMMLVFSARSGALAARIGPRPQLVIGPLLTVLGVLMFSRLGEGSDWLTDVLPGAMVFGVGLVGFVAPLTSTVMQSVDQRLVGTASGVNNAIARTAGLVAIAVIPGVAGLTMATGAAELSEAFRRAMYLTAGLGVVGALVSALFLPRGPVVPMADAPLVDSASTVDDDDVHSCQTCHVGL